jgi:O-acetyl-ADP-ribose deacetylase (regulator of RNase III)
MTFFEIVLGDITKAHVDAIVNAAHPTLLGGGGVDGAIHRAGGPEILAECMALRRNGHPDGLDTGDAVSTTAGDLPSKWVIHTVGPIFHEGRNQDPMLRSAYTNSLQVARELGAKTVAFPLISAGAFGWPKRDAIKQAMLALNASRHGFTCVMLIANDEDTYALMNEVLDEMPKI